MAHFSNPSVGEERWVDPWDLLTSQPRLVSRLLFILQVEDSVTKTRCIPSKEWPQEKSSGSIGTLSHRQTYAHSGMIGVPSDSSKSCRTHTGTRAFRGQPGFPGTSL